MYTNLELENRKNLTIWLCFNIIIYAGEVIMILISTHL